MPLRHVLLVLRLLLYAVRAVGQRHHDGGGHPALQPLLDHGRRASPSPSHTWFGWGFGSIPLRHS